ncbi:class I SAM-dependent methyltransferase [Litorimonas sp. RW-G-Af-16]|uniref:class I SAM-dependent methyltransferase n=1 Tax=Litorimonas sp. RW-G-Af-16 TaxID=3241168 RepID=UPI003AAF77A4
MSRLKTRLTEYIREAGPISVAEYMTFCLLDPVNGYYPTRDPLGSDGDFITAPEISQMFGEVLGLWCVQSWIDLGRPPEVNLIELGPGRGIMMSDMLRAAKLDSAFQQAVRVTLVEASSALEAVQGHTLASCGLPVMWASDLAQVPAGPSIIIGNEFLDCLPIRQLICADRFAGHEGWVERRVGLNEDGDFRFVKDDTPISSDLAATLPAGAADARNDDLLEINPSAAQLLDQINARFQDYPGRALFIDYGPDSTEFGDSLQALKRHEKVGVFSDPGNTDLTARVDFAALHQTAQSIGLDATEAVPQREFLSKLGIEMRAVALARAKPEAKDTLTRQFHRLTAEDEMGTLFKAMVVQSQGLPMPLGLR